MADGTHLSGVKPGAGAKLNGLKVTGLAEAPALAADGMSSRFAVRVALPQQFGGATSDAPIVLNPGKAAAAASEPLSFNVANASIGPIGLEQLKVTFDGEDLWEISTRIALPDPIPYKVSADAGIRGGAFEHAGAEVQFGTPGIGPFGPGVRAADRVPDRDQPETQQLRSAGRDRGHRHAQDAPRHHGSLV